MSKRNQILVTGAAGFIGSKVCEFLLTKPELIPSELIPNDLNDNNGLNAINVIGLDNLNDYYDVRFKEWCLPADMMATWAEITNPSRFLISNRELM